MIATLLHLRSAHATGFAVALPTPRALGVVALASLASVAACTAGVALDDDLYRAHRLGALTVLGTDSANASVRGAAIVEDGSCVVVGDDCIVFAREGERCAPNSGPADAIVINGEAVEVICYPTDEDGEVLVVNSDTEGSLRLALTDIAQRENGLTVVFEGEANHDGDITIDANNVAFYGNAPGETVIDGDVIVDGNNVRLRGLRITGDLILRKNNASVVLSEVDGDVIVEGNNADLAAVVIAGDVRVRGNNTVMVQLESEGDIDLVEARNTTCADVHLVDADANDRPFACPR